ncbi:MAG: DUF3450 family protein [Lentimonas sp.]
MKYRSKTITTVLLSLLLTPFCCANGTIETARTTVKEWIATENAISAEAIAWEEKKELLNDLIAVIRAEGLKHRESIDEIKATATAADTIRTELLSAQESLSKSESLLLDFLKKMEPRIVALKTSLPQPLIDKLKPLYQRIPAKPETSTLSNAERLQTIIGILTTIQQFDKTVTVTESLRELKDGSTVEVQTLYLGLGAAYYKTRAGDDAGIGTPSAEGWVWMSQTELSHRIAAAMDIAENVSQEARFINLPVQLSNP